jgi:cystathionine gamma-synthase
MIKGKTTSLLHSPSSTPMIGRPLGMNIPLTSTWVLPLDGSPDPEHDYGRCGSESMRALEEKIGLLDGAKYCTVFGSGIAALNAIIMSLNKDAIVLAEQNIYGNSIRMLQQFTRWGLKVFYTDFTSLEGLNKIEELSPQLILIESPTNPLAKIIDISAVKARATKVGATLTVDNTWATALNQLPLDLGADLVLLSLTKFYNGHSTAMGGAVTTNDKTWADKLYFNRKTFGLQQGIIETAVTLQGIHTMSLRLSQASCNALRLAHKLEQTPKVDRVLYPALPSHPQHTLAMRQMTNGGTLVVINIDSVGTMKEIDIVIDRLAKFFYYSHSFGSTKSQLCHPARMSHAHLTNEERLKVGITDGLLRLSIGIEDYDDIEEAVLAAFDG